MRLHEYMEAHNLTKVGFSEISGISAETIKRILNGNYKKIQEGTKEKLAVFGIYEGGELFFRFFRRGQIVAAGTLAECSEILGITEEVLYRYTTPSHHKNVKSPNGLIGVKTESGRLLNKQPKKVINKDEEKAVETIFKIKNKRSGTCTLSTYNQVDAVKEWLKSRGYKYKCSKIKQGNYEIKFAKVG